ncbi:MAG TPA: c-type cytochrome [Steroidobacteraceae bacterium]|jgi:cytochrome c|nr:c-type cytochrome [Steroidobacteraceae bacterium]
MKHSKRFLWAVGLAAGAALLVSVAAAVAAEKAGSGANAEPAAATAAAPDGGGGQAAFNNNCRTCHSAKEGDNRLGPSLHGIVGAKAGARPGYPSYSGALKGSGITWDASTLDRFIANPDAVIPNNNMKPFKGVPDAAVRKSIVEYLGSSG